MKSLLAISLEGKPRQMRASETFEAVDFYGSLLLSKKLQSGIFIDIVYASNIEDAGICEWMDTNHRPKEFRITIFDDLSRRNTLLALAHEMCHVRQYARGQLKELVTKNGINKRIIRWENRYVNLDKVHYYDTPWEIDAKGREFGLYDRYLESIGEPYDITIG